MCITRISPRATSCSLRRNCDLLTAGAVSRTVLVSAGPVRFVNGRGGRPEPCQCCRLRMVRVALSCEFSRALARFGCGNAQTRAAAPQGVGWSMPGGRRWVGRGGVRRAEGRASWRWLESLLRPVSLCALAGCLAGVLAAGAAATPDQELRGYERFSREQLLAAVANSSRQAPADVRPRRTCQAWTCPESTSRPPI